MNILIVGSGGREHALAWKISKSPLCKKLFVSPGNGGTSSIATNVDIQVNDFKKISEFIHSSKIDLVIVGPEEPLVKGLRDYLEKDEKLAHLRIIGPGSSGARLEGSKDFSKDFMKRNGIPAGKSKTFNLENIEAAKQYLKSLPLPIVLKADGLAAGKGVIISNDYNEAEASLKEMLQGKFGEASAKVVIEEYLNGIELSAFVLTDGKHYVILPEAKDYKRIGENDTGLNTGGMGAISPVSFATPEFLKKVEDQVVKPTIQGLQKESIDYCGFIFFGLMNCNGEPYVIEYNVRLGDPETEVVVPRIKTDLLELFIAAADRKLDQQTIEIDSSTATTVVMVAGGYPEEYEKGKEILGLEKVEDALAFHAGTKKNDAGKILSNGGRVLAITGMAESLEEALEKSYENLSRISWDNMNYRRDIGQDLLRLETN